MTWCHGFDWDSTLRDIWEGIRAQPARTALASFSVTLAVALLALLLMAISGLRHMSRTITEQLGANVFAILSPSNDAETALTQEHLRVMAAALPDCLLSGVTRFEDFCDGSRLAILATDPNLLEVRQWKLKEGRFLDWEDLRKSERYCFITAALAREKKLLLGDTLPLRNTLFRIVGIVDAGGGSLSEPEIATVLGGDQLAALVPLTSTYGWWDSQARRGFHTLDGIFVKYPGRMGMVRARTVTDRLLAAPDLRVKGAQIVEARTLLGGLRRLEMTIGLSLGSITLCTLLLTGLVLMVLTVANVRDRVVEIGLRRALGATAADVKGLFLLESCVLTSGIATIASGATHLVVAALRRYIPFPIAANIWTWCTPVLFSLVLAGVFAYGPARSASRLSPAEALRSE
ncbi:MAG: ABC transporter permease [Kiritimatiellia bacterium]